MPVEPTTALLDPVDAINCPVEQAREHNLVVVTVLQNGAADAVTLQSSRDNTKMHVRAIYSALLVGLMALLSPKKPAERRGIGFITVIAIGLMYLLDVHLADLDRRNVLAGNATENAIRTIINLPPASMTWYNLNRNKLQKQIEYARIDSFERKQRAAFYPDAEQCVFYIVPLILVIMVISRDFMGKRCGILLVRALAPPGSAPA